MYPRAVSCPLYYQGWVGLWVKCWDTLAHLPLKSWPRYFREREPYKPSRPVSGQPATWAAVGPLPAVSEFREDEAALCPLPETDYPEMGPGPGQ